MHTSRGAFTLLVQHKLRSTSTQPLYIYPACAYGLIICYSSIRHAGYYLHALRTSVYHSCFGWIDHRNRCDSATTISRPANLSQLPEFVIGLHISLGVYPATRSYPSPQMPAFLTPSTSASTLPNIPPSISFFSSAVRIRSFPKLFAYSPDPVLCL